MVVTEYGIADLRGRTDEEVIMAMIEVADSRFQGELLREAKRAAKIRSDYRIPDRVRNNRPERLEAVLARYRERGLFPEFPFGTDLTEEEMLLRKALSKLEQIAQRENLHRPRLREIRKTVTIPSQAQPYLERMMLDQPHTLKERLLQRALVYALASVDAI